MNLRIITAILFLAIAQSAQTQILPGAGRPSEYLPFLNGKKVAVVANAASVVNGVNTVDTLLAMNVNVRKIFAPEHGLRIEAEAGQEVSGTTDSATSLPVI